MILFDLKAAFTLIQTLFSLIEHRQYGNLQTMLPGGYDGNTFLDSVECYDPETDSWLEVTHMTSGRSGVGVAVTMEPCQKDLPQCDKCHENGTAAASSSAAQPADVHHSRHHGGPCTKGT